MIHTYFRFEIIKPVIDQKPALIEYKPALMPKQSWSHEALLHQDHKGPRAIMECDPLAVLSGLRIDAAGLIYLVRFDGFTHRR